MGGFDIVLATAIMASWGANMAIGKSAMEHFTPFFLTSLRFLVVALPFLFLARWPRQKFKDLLLLSITFGTLHFGLLFAGIARIDASLAAVLVQVQVPISACLGAWVFKEHLSGRIVAGMACGMGGVIVLAAGPSDRPDLLGVGMVLGASLAWALAQMQIKRLDTIDGFVLNGWIAVLAAPQLLFLSLIFESDQTELLMTASVETIAAVLFMGLVASLIAYGLWSRLVQRNSLGRMVAFTLLVPPFGIFFGVWLLGESVSWPLFLGGLLTIAGVGLVVSSGDGQSS